MLHLSHLQPLLPVYLSCKWPVYNQRTIYQCVQMSHAGNDEILYIYLHIINKEYKYFQASEPESVHCVPYSQNELQYIVLATSVCLLYVIVIYQKNNFFYIYKQSQKQQDVLDSYYVIQTEVMCKTRFTSTCHCQLYKENKQLHVFLLYYQFLEKKRC